MFERIQLLLSRISILAFIFTISSCATILGGSKNTVRVEAGSPENAQVYLDGEFLGEAPFKIKISKYLLQEGSMIEIKKDGFETMIYKVERSPHIGYVVVDALLVVALVIDVANGNIYRPNTRMIEYELVPLMKKSNAKSTLQEK